LKSTKRTNLRRNPPAILCYVNKKRKISKRYSSWIALTILSSKQSCTELRLALCSATIAKT
jgi:hypothetical protein